MVGSAVARILEQQGHTILGHRSAELDLRNQLAVHEMMRNEQPDWVVVSAAKVGGIGANSTYPADFIYDNLLIEANLIHASHISGVERLIFLGSSCIYPRDCPQPMKEEHLLSGPLEATNRPYAVAKIAGIELCASYNRQYGTRFLAAMPTNLYGPGDNYHLENSHVIPALLRKMHEAKLAGEEKVLLWGSGTPLREFLYSEDLAEAIVFLLELPENTYNQLSHNDQNSWPLINIGSGIEVSIAELASHIKQVVGYEGSIRWDTAQPDGTPRKRMDSSRIQSLGWAPKTPLVEGLEKAYQNFLTSLSCVS